MSVKQIIKMAYLKCYWKGKCHFGKCARADLRSTFNGRNYLAYNTEVINAHWGYASGAGRNCFLKDIKIGKYVCMANDIKTVIGIHPSSDFVSIHPVFYSKKQQRGFSYVNEECFEVNKRLDKQKEISICIGNDVWIGSGVMILEGVTIGDGAIVGAGAVVVKDVPPYAIVGGCRLG